MPTSYEWSQLQFQAFLDLNIWIGESVKASSSWKKLCRPFRYVDIYTYNVLLTYVEVVFASSRKWLAVNKQILQGLEDKTDIFLFDFSGGAALPESPVQLFKSRNAWSCSRCHSELVGMLLAAQYRHSGGSQERERTSNSCRTTPHGGRQSCLCSSHCPQKSCHWPTKQRTHRWVKSMFFSVVHFQSSKQFTSTTRKSKKNQ